MKKLYLLILVFVIALVTFQPAILGQQIQVNTQNRTTPERAAEGQTKWMVKQLNIHVSFFQELYKINLKYQSKLESLRTIKLDVADKRIEYLLINKTRNEELKDFLTREQYDNYQIITGEQKARALEIRKDLQLQDSPVI